MQPLSYERVREALACIPADLPRDDWVRMAMALKSALGDEGFAMFDDWSQRGGSYSASDARATWRSIKPEGGIGIATLVREAKRHGFRGTLRLGRLGAGASAEPAPKVGKPTSAPRTDSATAELQRHRTAAERAAAIWRTAHDGRPCAYLTRKGVQAYGVRTGDDGRLVVPLRDGAGELWNVQRIEPERQAGRPDKLLLGGGRKSGLWHWCGDPAGADVLLLAEGYATAATLHEATGWPVAMAIDAGNLAHVARSVRQAWPQALIAVCADDDRPTAQRTGTNVGHVKAEAAARAVGGIVILPDGLPEGGTDFNDLALHAGLAEVQRTVTAAVQRHQAADAADLRNVTAPAAAATNVTAEGSVTGADPYTLDERGVWFHDRDKEGNALHPLRVCDPLRVVAQTCDNESGTWGLLLEFANPRGALIRWAMPNRMLAGDGTEFRAALMDRGLRIGTSQRQRALFARYVESRQPDRHVRCTSRLGWHAASYVFPDETLGTSDEPVVYQSEGFIVPTIGQRGSLADWQQHVARLCVDNTRLAFAVCCAFAGPLLRLANVESGGFHIRGESSSGKTTALRVAASVYGGPGFVQRWRATDNALESIAAQHCDLLLILDELAQLDPRTAGEVAYMLANEQSKARSTRSGQARPRLSWRLLFLSAGEIGLAAHMAEGGKRARAGQETRLADVPADAGAGLGIFETLHGLPGPADLARRLTKACEHQHGAVGRAWIEWLVTHRDDVRERLRSLVEGMLKQWLPAAAGGQVHRVAERFAVVAAAGEIATAAGLTAWAYGQATKAAQACFEAWLADRGGAGNAEQWQMLQQVREFFERNGDSRFVDLDRDPDTAGPVVHNRAGFRRKVKADSGEVIGTVFFVLPNVFRSEIAEGFDPKAVLRLLRDEGHLKPGQRRPFDFSVRLPGIGKTNCYRIADSILGDRGNDDPDDED